MTDHQPHLENEWVEATGEYFALVSCTETPPARLADAWQRIERLVVGPEDSFRMTWMLASAAAAASRTVNGCGHNCTSDHGAGIAFVMLGPGGGLTQVPVDDVPPVARLIGRFIAAAHNDDVDAARALWSTIPPDQDVVNEFLTAVLFGFVPQSARALHRWAIANAGAVCSDGDS